MKKYNEMIKFSFKNLIHNNGLPSISSFERGAFSFKICSPSQQEKGLGDEVFYIGYQLLTFFYKNLTKGIDLSLVKLTTLLFYLSFLITTDSFAQNTTRPNVIVPNGFEVNSYTGNLYQSRTDMKISGQGLNIDISFSYNVSRRNKNWGMGKGWTFTYNMAYATDQLGIWIERPDGRRDLYTKSGAKYVAPAGIYDDLVEYETGKFYLKTKESLLYYFDNTNHKRLTKMQDANGNIINIAYTDTLISSLTDGIGHSIAFKWIDSKLSEITDNTCTTVRKVTYEYDNKGNPTKVTNPIGDFVKYFYDPTFKIIGYTDESGNNMSMSYNVNSAVIRITSCITTHQFTYLTQQLKTFVTEKVGGKSVVTTYTFDNDGRVSSKKGNCCGYNVDYVYDAQNNISNRKDGNKKETKYEYDTKGNVTKETDPAGNFTIYTYTNQNKIASITDKNSNTSTYEYDTKGNITQISKPLGVTEKYTYDAKGNKLSYTDGNGNKTSYEYDAKGNITKITDPEGGITAYTYDCYSNRLTETNPRGAKTTYQYNGLNQLVKTTDALNNTTTYLYNKQGQIASITNALGKITQYLYDGLGRRISTILPMGNTTQIEYDEQGNIIKKNDANGNAITYTYNNRKQPLSITDALGNTMYYDYDEAGNKISETDRNGNTTRFEYDDDYHLIKRTDALGGTTQYSYDALGNRIAEIDANGNATTYEFDALQRTVKVTDALGKSIQYTYDKNGNQLSQKDKNGNTTTNTYDKLNRVKTITNALGGITTYTYDANGNILTEKNALNNTTSYTYDNLDRRLTVKNALNEITTSTYDALGKEKTVTLPIGNTFTYTYNNNSRLQSVSDNLGALITYTYDNNGNMLTEKDGNGNTKIYQYDTFNRQVQTKDALNNFTIFEFDKNGNLLSQTDRNGKTKRQTFDALNRKSTETDALGNTTRFTYDALGNRLSIIDAKGNITSYNYDVLNRLTKETFADGTYQQYTYDDNGNHKTRRDGRGNITNYSYDALNRLTKRSYPNNTEETFSYDLGGRRLTANNVNATISFTYDNTNRLLSESLNGKTTTYAYNTSTRTRTLTYPSGKVIVEESNKRGQLINIKEGSVIHATFSYDAGNRLIKKTFANNYSSVYTYNANDWLTSLVCTPNNVINFSYTYDNEGNRITALKNHRSTHSEKYIYDNLYQLTGFYTGKLNGENLSDTTSKSRYTYDALHNRINSFEDGINRTYTTNSQNAYTSINTNGQIANYTYDGSGNTTADGEKAYTFDYENRLISVNNGLIAQYFYDALGRRVKTITSSETTTYYFKNNQILEEIGANNVIKKVLIYGIWLDDVVAYTYNENTYYLISNPQGSVLMALNKGNVLEKYEYNGFGKVEIFNSNYLKLTNSNIQNTNFFTGRSILSLVNQYDFRIRNYDFETGRFINKDRIGYKDGYNLYSAYFIPNNIDPFGLKECPVGREKCQKSLPESNGCGSPEKLFSLPKFSLPWSDEPTDLTENYISSEWIPELVFHSACNYHDECWGTCGNSMSVCNNEFFSRMISACNEAARNGIIGSKFLVLCYEAAAIYRGAVAFTDGTYEAAQENSCDCCCKK